MLSNSYDQRQSKWNSFRAILFKTCKKAINHTLTDVLETPDLKITELQSKSVSFLQPKNIAFVDFG